MSRIQHTILDRESGIRILVGDVDPSAAPGIDAPVGSIFKRRDTGATYHKTGTGVTDWALSVATPPGAGPLVSAVGFDFGDGQTAGTVGAAFQRRIPFACTITAAHIAADVSGSAVVDIRASTDDGVTFASIAASAKPTLASTQHALDTTLAGWTTAVAAGTVLRGVLQSLTTCKSVEVTLTLTRS